ncbi:MAG: hypothetical protein CO090_02605 [Acidobacteria bacterium CG_4_9_14_3_um_filter_49_7]|nr:MAG: hypothetical protein CO090_02605 [Acidobacteria bacterium CG_4_9_14_3_um_filter_49_7]
MVVLLVILTFAILLVGGIILERRENRERQEARVLRQPAQQAVFAQDGGEPRGPEAEKDRNIPWEDVESGDGAKFKSRKNWGKGREG